MVSLLVGVTRTQVMGSLGIILEALEPMLDQRADSMDPETAASGGVGGGGGGGGQLGPAPTAGPKLMRSGSSQGMSSADIEALVGVAGR